MASSASPLAITAASKAFGGKKNVRRYGRQARQRQQTQAQAATSQTLLSIDKTCCRTPSVMVFMPGPARQHIPSAGAPQNNLINYPGGDGDIRK
jgi:hypothetical protein